MRQKIKLLADLGKVRITLLSTFSTAMGYLSTGSGIDPLFLFLACAGTFLLACGSSALNQVQEREIDARMERTRMRPIPSGAISPAAATLVAGCFMAAGAILLSLLPSPLPLILGLVAALWYNGIYTPLKKWTPFAVVPGSLIGAIPPAIGWTAAGGGLLAPPIVALSFFFFLWQVPHFWLLLLRHGKEYEAAHLPSLTSLFSDRQLSRLTLIWTLACATSSLLIPLSGAVRSTAAVIFLVAIAFGISLSAAWTSKKEGSQFFRLAFHAINTYSLLIILLVSLDGYL
ncbi:MAG: hypothetical protein A2Z34_01730 [Planctomycetes bacterium RBG_16_59_8]|nr:MAG: hypothetical protein A2Z34_01730 [Planctomycetes bacterium RBG_16_59_8]